MTLAQLAMLPLLIALPVMAAAQNKTAPKPAPTATQPKKPPAPSPSATTTATVTVTDLSGAPIPDARVMLSGSLDRSGSTQTNGIVRFDGLRAGTYRARISKEGFVTLERDIEWRAGQPAPNVAVALSPEPKQAAPPPAQAPPAKATLPPPGKAVSLSLPDFIEKNYITNKEPQKTVAVACSGLSQTELWQIREPWENRQHPGADLALYVIGGEGTLRLDGREINMQAGHFASVPRGSSYALLRRGRNPNFIVLATLSGEPCQ